MVLCHSMNAGSVVGYDEVVGTVKSYLIQNDLNFLYLQMTGMQKLWAQVPSHLVEFPLPISSCLKL